MDRQRDVNDYSQLRWRQNDVSGLNNCSYRRDDPSLRQEPVVRGGFGQEMGRQKLLGGELDWANLNKAEVANRIFEPEIYEAYTRPDLFEARISELGDHEKRLVCIYLSDITGQRRSSEGFY